MNIMRERALQLLARLKVQGVDPQEVVEEVSAYLVRLGLFALDPDNEKLRKELDEAESAADLSAGLDTANEEGKKELERRSFFAELARVIAQLVGQVVTGKLMKGQGG